MLECNLYMNDNQTKGIFWFSKNGDFLKMEFNEPTLKMDGVIQPISSITFPDTSGIQMRESSVEDIMELFVNAELLFGYAVAEEDNIKLKTV